MDVCRGRATRPITLIDETVRWRLALAIILLISAAVYAPSMTGLPISDDHALLGGSGIGGGARFRDCILHPFLNHYFRPLVSISFFIEHHLWGGTPFFYHQTNVLIHVLTTLLLAWVLLLAFRHRGAALLGAALFAVQPVQSGAVAWIGGRTDAMAALFAVGFCGAVIAAVRCPARGRLLLAAGCAAFFCALLCKEQVLPMLLLVPLASRCFGEGPLVQRWRQGGRAMLPYAITAALFLCAWLWFYPDPLRPAPATLGGQLLTAGQTMAYYAMLLFTPTVKGLNSFTLGAMQSAAVAWAALGYAIAAGLIFLYARWLRTDAESAWFLALIALSMAAVLNFIPVPSLVIEEWRAGVAGLGAAAVLARFARHVNRRALAPLVGIYLLWSAAVTWQVGAVYVSDISTYTAYVRADPDALVFWTNLSGTNSMLGRHREAATALEAALQRVYAGAGWRTPAAARQQFERDPRVARRIQLGLGFDVPASRLLAELFGRLGMARRLCGAPGALPAFQAAMSISPASDLANLGLGLQAYDAGDMPAAVRYLRRAAAYNPQTTLPLRALAEAQAARGDWHAAAESYRALRKLRPWMGPLYPRLAEIEIRGGQTERAVETLHLAGQPEVLRTREENRRLEALAAIAREPAARACSRLGAFAPWRTDDRLFCER